MQYTCAEWVWQLQSVNSGITSFLKAQTQVIEVIQEVDFLPVRFKGFPTWNDTLRQALFCFL